MKSQKESVCNTILSVLSARGYEYELGCETPIKSVLTDDDKKQIRAIVLEGFMSGDISMTEQAREKYNDETKMKTYVSGVVNNWIKKNPEFNGGNKYVPANPGSRAGQGDEQIKALRGLKKTTNDPQALAEIETAINNRLAEIKPAQTVTIDVEALPEHLKHLVK